MTTRCSFFSLGGALAVGLLAVTACPTDGGSATDGGPGADASVVAATGGASGSGAGGSGGTGTGGSSGGRDGASDGAGGGATGGAGGGAAASTKGGQVLISSIAVGPVEVYTVRATFQDSVASSDSGCTNRTVGGCQVIRCPMTDAGAAPPAAGPAPHVGVISITGGARPVTLTPGSDGTYPSMNGSGSFWSGASPIIFSGAGGTIPAFPASPVDAPQRITDSKINGSTPAGAPARTSVSRAGGMRVTWTGGTGDLGLILGQVLGGNILSMVCRTPASGGTFSFPSMVVNELQAGDATLSLSQISSRTVTAGAYAITLSLGTNPNPFAFALTAE